MEPTAALFLGAVRFADALDIAVIALLIYLALVWFRDRASRSLIVIIVGFTVVFVCAHWLEMYLTTMLFQAGIIAVTLAFVIVFQQDIRRAFERLSNSRWLRPTQVATHADQTIDTLAQTITTLAAQKTGALLIFDGHEPSEPHLRGGVVVGAQISLPLLCSIFHSQSPGHDGAVLIRRERIERLGIHLPLSVNLAAIGSRGTRHAAALGLAERCDAMIIVVSEERGSINIAHNGQLTDVDPSRLAEYLRRWANDRWSETTGPPESWFHNFGWKAGSVAAAGLIWYLFAYQVETIQRTFVVPIEYRNLSEDWVIEEPRANRAELTLAGSERTFNVLDPTTLAVSFDLSHVRADTPVLLDSEASLKNVPDALSVNQIQPDELLIVVRTKQDNKIAPNNE